MDILDTRFENQDLAINENEVKLGDDLNLTEKDPLLKKLRIAVGWDKKAFGGKDVDVDICAFLLGHDLITREDQDFIFYNNLEAHGGAVKHEGDNRTGAGDGDDETILCDLHQIPFEIIQISLTFSIYRGHERDQNLSLLKKCYIRLLNDENNHELARFNLDAQFASLSETAAIVGSVNREGPKWHFTPRLEPNKGGLTEIAASYGLNIIRQ